MIAAQGEQAGTTRPPSAIRLEFVDGIRALAALYVMVYHAWLTAYWDTRQPSRLVSFVAGWLGYGHFAVGVFIVLSGFCLMLPIARGDGTLRGGAAAFFRRRARRILPPYYCALLLSIALAVTLLRHKTGTLWDYSLPVTKMGIAAHLLLVHNLHRSLEINSPMWSVAVEWQIYFLFPLLVILWARVGGVYAALDIVCASGIAFVLAAHTRLAGLNCQYLGLFGLGMLAAAVSYAPQAQWSVWRRCPWGLCAVGLFCGIVLICSERHLDAALRGTWFMELLVGLWAMTVLIYAAHPSAGALRRCLEWRPLAFIGMFSYSLYLLHLPLLQLVWQYGIFPLHYTTATAFLLLSGVGGAITMAASYLFFQACERPFLTRPALRRNKTA